VQSDGNLLCGDCAKYELAWQQEDFSYEEYDENDEIARAHTSGGKKKAVRLRNKAAKKKTKSEIECIDLSSDEEDEDEEEFELDDSDDFSDGDDDEVQVVSHFFGTPNESEEELEDPESDDPFANMEDWVADDEDKESKDSKDDNEEEDDDIMILE